MSIVVSLLTAGSNSHQESSENANAVATDFASQGAVGTITSTSGVAPSTGSFAVNAQGSPNMTVAVSSGTAYVAATPTAQGSQTFRVKNSASANVTIASNASGSTKYDWIYISMSAANAANPAVNGDNVATLVASRSSNSITDDGTPPTYGYALAVVTVANGAVSISNSNIADKRVRAAMNNSVSFSGLVYDFVESGCVWTADAAASTLNASMTAGFVWISGVRLSVSAVSGRAFTASKDTYIDLNDNSDGTAAFTYTAVTNNAASQALPSGSLRIGIIVTGASSIAASTSINQGQESRVLPIASSIAYAVTDSLGNLICPRDPNRRILGYRQIVASPGTFTTIAQVTGLTCPVIVPTGRKAEVTVHANSIQNSSAGAYSSLSVWDGVVNAGTQLNRGLAYNATATGPNNMSVVAVTTPSSASKTYNAGADNNGAGTVSFGSIGATGPVYIIVKLV